MYTYDEFDRLMSATRGGLMTTMIYDGAGRKISMSDPDMGNWAYTYDALGNLTRQKDARGQRICLYYDLLNRLTAKHYRTDDSCPVTQPASPEVLYTYDTGIYGKGHRTKAENKVDSIVSQWGYDERGRVKTETVMGYTTEWGYNSADLPIWMEYPDGMETVDYTYNNQMLLERLSGTSSGITTNYLQSVIYDETGRVDERTLGNNLIQDYEYYAWNEKATVDAQQIGQGGRLKNISVGNLQNLSYVYDAGGNIRNIADSITSETQAFGYDALDRLISATATGGPAPYTERYSYHATTGNLATKASDVDTPPAPNPGTTGLAAWWSMDQTSGTRSDSHNANHLTDINTVGSTTGLRGNAASFVPANLEVLRAADSPALSGGDVDFTLIANVYLNNNTNTFVIMDKSDGASVYDYRLAHQAGTGFRFRVSASTYVDSGAVTANAWHMVVAWHDSVNDTINIQVDNGTVNSVPFSGGTSDTGNPLAIGAFQNGTTGLDGRIDEVAIYRRVLTADERAWLYKNGEGRIYLGLSINYTYGDPAHAHAVTALMTGGLANHNTYQYDANGNMIQRVLVNGQTFALDYDAENRLVKVCEDTSNNAICDSGETVTASFIYDADGKRVKSVLGSETTLFVGGHYEVANPGSGQTITKYYFASAQRIAMRKYTIPSSMAVEYLLGDHLGSTSLTTDVTGAKVSEIRYTAWGEIRYSWTSGVAATPNYKLSGYTFTGQYSYMDDPTNGATEGFGLMFYNARWYDPILGRFAQADTIIPVSQGIQAYDRYAYVSNNPLRYTDPTGHRNCEEDGYNCPSDKVIRVGNAPGTPEERLALFNKFKEFMGDSFDWLTAEESFMKWIYGSGRFNSPFWNSANGYLLMSMIAGMEASMAGITQAYIADPGVQEWINFIHDPAEGNFWLAHNAALREGESRAIASGALAQETKQEQQFIQKALRNVYTLGDACGAGDSASCVLASSITIQASLLTYPQKYPANAGNVALTMDYSGNWLTDAFDFISSGLEYCLTVSSVPNSCVPQLPR